MPSPATPRGPDEAARPCLKLLVPLAPERVAEARQKVETFLQACGHDAETIQAVALALEELAMNVIQQTGKGRPPRHIWLELLCPSDKIELRLTDDGPQVDPQAQAPRAAVPGEERTVGGLEIHFVRRLDQRVEIMRWDRKCSVTLLISPRRQP